MVQYLHTAWHELCKLLISPAAASFHVSQYQCRIRMKLGQEIGRGKPKLRGLCMQELVGPITGPNDMSSLSDA